MTLHVFHAVERVSNHMACHIERILFSVKNNLENKTENTFLDGTIHENTPHHRTRTPIIQKIWIFAFICSNVFAKRREIVFSVFGRIGNGVLGAI